MKWLNLWRDRLRTFRIFWITIIRISRYNSSEFGRDLIRQYGNYHIPTNYSESVDK
jgi:hypothetical protein